MALELIFGFFYLFSDVFYWAKWIISFIAIHLWKRFHHQRFDLYDFEVESEPEKLSILAPKEERLLDSPFPEEHLYNAADSIFIYGVNSKSEALVVQVTRFPNDEAEALIYLQLEDGRCYELAERTGFQRNFGGQCTSFTCQGLQMHYLVPMRRWRVNFCGMLKEGIKKNENTEQKEVFVKFTFLWTASSDVYDPSCEFGIRATAKAMAKAKWTSPIPPIQRVSETLNFYYQSGVISGIVSIENQPDVEMYLFGERTRYLGEFSSAAGCKFKHILGVIPESGLVIHLGRGSVQNTFHNLHFGFIVHPNGMNVAIEDGMIISRMSGNVESGEELTATFKAGKRYEMRGNFVGDSVSFRSDQAWKGSFEMIGIEFEVDGIKGRGFMIYGEIPKLLERKCPKIHLSLPEAKPLTVYFTDEACEVTDLTGGKGSSLGMLTKLSRKMNSEFIVPKGIVVTTAAYKEFLNPDLVNKIERMKDIVYGNTTGNIHEAYKIVTSSMEREYLPDQITKEIEEKLNKLFGGNINRHKFAVRSSATGEDTDVMSAAGQMDTFLGVQGLKQIFTAVKKCWASQFGYIATEYKRQNGQILNSPMAVVIQQMVESEASGVLFTCDPVTNNPSVVFITCNYGLGESVVSGSEEPDTVVLRKRPNQEVEIESVTVGLKQHRIVMADKISAEDENTVLTEIVPEDKRNECCISQEMSLKLGELALKIENHFKSPRDIEWGIKDGTIFILQSRPVTTSAAVSDYEIKHEFDGPLRCEGEYLTLCNVGEALPGATSPLGLDIMGRTLVVVFQKKVMQERQKNSFQKQKYFPSGFIIPFYNHVTMNVVNLLTRDGDIDTTNAQSLMIAFFGRLLDDPDLKVQAKFREPQSLKKDLSFYIKTLTNLFFVVQAVPKLKEEIFSFKNPAIGAKTSKEIFDRIMENCSHNVKPFIVHILNTESSSLWNMYLLSLLKKSRGTVDNDVYSDFAKLLSSSSNVESADVPSAMQELAQWIMQDTQGVNFKSMTVEDAQKWLETSSGAAAQKYQQFIQRHGHRCLKEFDVNSHPWRMNPKPLIKLLQNMMGSGRDMKEKKEKDFSELVSELNVRLDMKSKLLLKFLLPFCRRGVRTREACKSILIKSMDNIRTGFQHLSKAMVAEGYLPDANLLFFLGIDEIYELLQFRNPALISRANHRRKLYPTLDSYILPEIWRGRPVPIIENEDKFEYVADLTMKGIPVSQGITKGYARVALNLDEASHLKPGEILITHSTDIGWSPYFPILAGVVTELGGLVSHGAVVSREYGLPCVVGLHGATSQFVTGDFVLLDGNKGILQRLTPPDQ